MRWRARGRQHEAFVARIGQSSKGSMPFPAKSKIGARATQGDAACCDPVMLHADTREPSLSSARAGSCSIQGDGPTTCCMYKSVAYILCMYARTHTGMQRQWYPPEKIQYVSQTEPAKQQGSRTDVLPNALGTAKAVSRWSRLQTLVHVPDFGLQHPGDSIPGARSGMRRRRAIGTLWQDDAAVV